MTREQIHIGDMSHETAIDILKLLLEAMETYDGILPTPARINAIKMSIEALEQEPKTGHWIHHKEVLYESAEHWECSNCHKSTMTDPAYPHNDFNHMYFCPKCGAKMIEPQESEDDA